MAPLCKIIFLDIDGVLNSGRTAEAFGRYPYDIEPDSLPLFDVVVIGLIRKACKLTRAQIILSSGWRKIETFGAIGAALDLPIVGATPDMSRSSALRGDEIQAWLCSHGDQNVIWVAVDDNALGYVPSQMSRLVKTSPRDGLSYENYYKILRELNKNSVTT